MILTIRIAGAAALVGLGAGAALAEPALIYDVGGQFDGSFNEAAYRGAERWAEETGGSYSDFALDSGAQREQYLRRFAERGSDPVITTGFAIASTLEQVAPDYPDTTFVNIDGQIDTEEHPNVRVITFAEHQGSYLAGIAAAMASETGTVGFVGGMDVPLIRKFGCGYAQGAKSVDADMEVLTNMTGTRPSAWNDPTAAGEIAQSQIDRGADVIFAAAGGSGIGVLDRAADAGIYSIGVDSNQNARHPGSVLTSMLKRVDVAVHDAMAAGADLEGGAETFSMADNGVGLARDENNDKIFTDAMAQAVDEARQAIIDGEVEVVDYAESDSCPAVTF